MSDWDFPWALYALAATYVAEDFARKARGEYPSIFPEWANWFVSAIWLAIFGYALFRAVRRFWRKS